MNERTKIGLEILQAAVLLGILGDVLIRAEALALNGTLFLGAVAAALVMLRVRHRREDLTPQVWALHGAVVIFAAMFAWRDSGELIGWKVVSLFVIFAALALPALRIKTQIAGAAHYVLGFIVSSLNSLFGPLMLLIADIKWGSFQAKGGMRHMIAVIRGLLIATPLILIFGGLFVAADAVFEGFVTKTLNIKLDTVISHVFLTGVFAWLLAGYLRGSLFEIFAIETVASSVKNANDPVPSIVSVTDPAEEKAPETSNTEKPRKERNWQDFDNSMLPSAFTLGGVETAIVLGLLDLLFLSFVIIQIPYLFGGMDLVQNTPDFKLAEFARRGFGELVVVSVLVLPILLTSHWLLRKDNPWNEKLYRVLAGIQIVLLFVVMASAAQRLLLLTGPLGYGLTAKRSFPMVFMIWLALVFGWFAVTVLRGARKHFAWGALWSGLIILAALHFVNPEAFIVKTNLRLMQQGRPFDARYNAGLSGDAVPALLEGLPSMSPEDQCTVSRMLRERVAGMEELNKDVRSWNWSRSSAAGQIRTNEAQLEALGCSAVKEVKLAVEE